MCRGKQKRSKEEICRLLGDDVQVLDQPSLSLVSFHVRVCVRASRSQLNTACIGGPYRPPTVYLLANVSRE